MRTTLRVLAVSVLAIAALSPATMLAQRTVAEPVSPTRVVAPTSSSSSSSSFAPSYRSSSTPSRAASPKKAKIAAPVTGTVIIDADGNSCPVASTDIPAFPSPVYDVAKGDCHLKGKGPQITAYLKKLKKIADGCKKEIPAQWKKTKQAKKDLDVSVDGLPSPEPDVHFFAASPSCNDFSSQNTEAFDISGTTSSKAKYTTWLKKITDDTALYCTMVQEIIKPLADACSSIAMETQCLLTMQTANGISDADKKSYRSTIDIAMKVSTVKYNVLDSVYKNTLAKNGWDAFTSVYKESNVSCGTTSSAGKDSYTKEEE